jgi:hypothetical protein
MPIEKALTRPNPDSAGRLTAIWRGLSNPQGKQGEKVEWGVNNRCNLIVTGFAIESRWLVPEG